MQWEKRYRGLCRHEYFVGVPAERIVSETYSETTFKLEPAKIKVSALCLSVSSARNADLSTPPRPPC